MAKHHHVHEAKGSNALPLCQKKRGESEKAGGGCQLKVKNFKLRRITGKNTLVSTTKQTAFCIYTLMNKIFLSLKLPLMTPCQNITFI